MTKAVAPNSFLEYLKLIKPKEWRLEGLDGGNPVQTSVNAIILSTQMAVIKKKVSGAHPASVCRAFA